MSLQSDMDDKVHTEGLFFLLGLFLVVLCVGAFLFKVWNERQMTHEYHAQSLQQKRIADNLSAINDKLSQKSYYTELINGNYSHWYLAPDGNWVHVSDSK